MLCIQPSLHYVTANELILSYELQKIKKYYSNKQYFSFASPTLYFLITSYLVCIQMFQ